MNTKKILNFIVGFLCWIIIVIILQNILGWTEFTTIDNIIGLAAGWIVWKALTFGLNKKFSGKGEK